MKRLSKASIFFHKLDQEETKTHQPRSSDFYAVEANEPSELYGIFNQPARLISPYSSSFTTAKSRLTGKPDGVTYSSSDASSSSGVALSAGSSTNAGQEKLEPSRYPSSSGFISSSTTFEYNKAVKIFDMNKFKKILERESRRPCPNRRRLQSQCISIISFVVDDQKLLNLPSWIMIINIVAIDLLRSEIGLIDSQDLFGQPAAPPPLPPSIRGVFATGSERSRLQLGAAAAKRAFADAAATGAYNPDHHRQHVIKNKVDSSREIAAELEHRRDQQFSKTQRVELLPQSSGCSSGFNSQCSSQDNSLAQLNNTDSSQSIDSSTVESSDKHDSERRGEALIGYNKLLTSQVHTKQDLEIQAELANAAVAAAKTPRGKRPPKLPHRLDSPTAKMSEPIPIPAPPTSAGADASGTANLILVSPTGLSPPLPKRKNTPTKKPLWTDPNVLKPDETTSVGQSIVEESQQVTRPYLPAGIPAHAQLAPPATQRHILKYLMSSSATTSSPRDISDAPAPNRGYASHIPAPPMRYQRPLPILPVQSGRYARQPQSCQEENLYYCGMQARVSAPRPRNAKALPSALQPVSHEMKQRAALQNSAINSMMPDFTGGRILNRGQPVRNVSHLQSASILKHQHSLTNLKDSNFYLKLYDSSQGLSNERRLASGGSKALMMRLFNSKTSPKQHELALRVNASLEDRSKALFLSADNLHQASHAGKKASPTSILGQMGLKLKGSRSKK